MLTLVLVTTGKVMTLEELSKVQGRAWEDVDVSALKSAYSEVHTMPT